MLSKTNAETRSNPSHTNCSSSPRANTAALSRFRSPPPATDTSCNTYNHDVETDDLETTCRLWITTKSDCCSDALTSLFPVSLPFNDHTDHCAGGSKGRTCSDELCLIFYDNMQSRAHEIWRKTWFVRTSSTLQMEIQLFLRMREATKYRNMIETQTVHSHSLS